MTVFMEETLIHTAHYWTSDGKYVGEIKCRWEFGSKEINNSVADVNGAIATGKIFSDRLLNVGDQIYNGEFFDGIESSFGRVGSKIIDSIPIESLTGGFFVYEAIF